MSQPFPFSDRRYGYRCASHSQCVARGFPNNNSGESFPQQGGNIAQIVFDHQVTVSLDEPRFKDRVVDERIFPVIPQLLPNSCRMVLPGFCKNHLSCVTEPKIRVLFTLSRRRILPLANAVGPVSTQYSHVLKSVRLREETQFRFNRRRIGRDWSSRSYSDEEKSYGHISDFISGSGPDFRPERDGAGDAGGTEVRS